MRWKRPESPLGVEHVVDDMGTIFDHNAPMDGQPMPDDTWKPRGGHVRWTWSQLLSNSKWVEACDDL